MLSLQRTLGNQAVQRMIAAGGGQQLMRQVAGGNGATIQREGGLWDYITSLFTGGKEETPKGGATTKQEEPGPEEGPEDLLDILKDDSKSKALASTMPAPQALKAMKDRGIAFHSRIECILTIWPGVKLNDIRDDIEAATQPQRDRLARDSGAMTRIKARTDNDTFLGLLPALRVFEPSTVKLGGSTAKFSGHMPGPEADKFIKAHMQKLGLDGITKDRRVEGEVSVVGDSEWNEAFKRQWGPFGYTDPTVCNAFVDVNLPGRHIWVHKDRGNPGTVVHEGMHKYADPTLRDSLIGQYKLKGVSKLDEGLTEVYTREVVTPLGIKRDNYAEEFQTATKLIAAVGADLVMQAYFAGGYSALILAFAKLKPGIVWDDFTAALEGGKFSQAEAML